ncbi:hypothetical protein NQD34_017936 [Periophthalmus magnuspinnatus]|nr:hypothetical protein NQD34_017936 [Periophthalmus magnuspinnatus]
MRRSRVRAINQSAIAEGHSRWAIALVARYGVKGKTHTHTHKYTHPHTNAHRGQAVDRQVKYRRFSQSTSVPARVTESTGAANIGDRWCFPANSLKIWLSLGQRGELTQ